MNNEVQVDEDYKL